ncbi:hypothetical protein [Cupriavidus necator]|uniref:hypothetical protein n=1 Tax=Cupriavidus necator TaxID=106590 RepID=UPI0015A209D5|nr:hypothetical protein [Cupriavidus necator]
MQFQPGIRARIGERHGVAPPGARTWLRIRSSRHDFLTVPRHVLHAGIASAVPHVVAFACLLVVGWLLDKVGQGRERVFMAVGATVMAVFIALMAYAGPDAARSQPTASQIARTESTREHVTHAGLPWAMAHLYWSRATNHSKPGVSIAPCSAPCGLALSDAWR